jgi:transcriptional regulator with XRE-family HTH domain
MRSAKRLRRMREAGSVSLSEVVKQTGISTTRLSNFENGFATLTLQEEQMIGSAIVDLTHGRSTIVAELSESERKRRESARKVAVDESARSRRRKEILRGNGMSEKEASLGAEIRGDVRGVPRQFRGPRNGH